MRKSIGVKTKLLIIATLAILLTACDREASVTDLDGNVIKLADLKGKWVVVNYWASWCKPCLEEIPELNAFYQSHKNTDAIVLGVNYDHADGPALQKIVSELNVAFPTLTKDPAALFGIGQIPGLPASYLIAPNGKLKNTLFGTQSQASLELVIKESS